MKRHFFGRFAALLLGLAISSEAVAQNTTVKPPQAPPDELLIRVQDETRPPTAPPSQPAPVQPPPVAPPPITPAPSGAPAVPSGTTQAPRSDPAPGGSSGNTIPVSATADGGAGAAAAASSANVGNLLQRSDQAQGVEVQQRNAVSIDPRIRGFRTGQYYTTADGAAFFPARLDLDTPISKFDSGSIRDVRVIRGPYTSLLGPAFSFLDIATVDTPRSTNGGVEYHGRSALGYQTNGSQWNALQAFSAAGENWGFRGTYNFLQGSDYRDGAGDKIPSHYLSNNFNYALGFNLTERSSIEFKGLRVRQNNLELPGLYFDIRQSDTEAYNLRYSVSDFGVFNNVTLNTWYNTTVGTGDTRNAPKQLFVDTLLASSFSATRPGVPFSFTDSSTTRFGERTLGYRLSGVWGNNKDELTVTAGTDLNMFGQGLQENIQFTQQGIVSPTGVPSTNIATLQPFPSGVGATITQQQSIPNSDSVNPGLFVEAMLPVDKRLKIRSGGRIDFVRTTADGSRLITGNLDLFGPAQTVLPAPTTIVNPIDYSTNPDRNQGMTRNFTLFSGFASAEYLLNDETTLFLNYGHAERAPTLTELYAAGPFIGVLQQGTSRLIGDPNLKKEQLNQIDAGLRADYGWLQAGATGFFSLINNYITYDANKLSNAGLSQVVYTNTDLATLAGTELFIQANVTDWLTPFATLSYVQGVDQTHADNSRPANLASSRRDNPASREAATQTEALPQIPPMESRVGLRVHQPTKTPKWQVELWARMVAGQNNVATSLGELPTPGFTTWNIRGYWQVNKAWMLTAGVENIGDILYREHLDPISSTLLNAQNPAVAPLYRPGTNFFFTSQLTY